MQKNKQKTSRYLEVALAFKEHLVDLERHAHPGPHGRQLGEPPLLGDVHPGAGGARGSRGLDGRHRNVDDGAPGGRGTSCC